MQYLKNEDLVKVRREGSCQGTLGALMPQFLG